MGMHEGSTKRAPPLEWEEAAAAAVEEEEEDPISGGAAKKPKVPALASVIIEALKLDSLQRLCSSLEPLLRRIVSEEVERALTRLGHSEPTGRSSPRKIEGQGQRKLQLHFRSRLPPHLFTGGKVEGDQGTALHVVLIDANTGMVVPSGPESMAKLDVVVLGGDFNLENDDDWTEGQFESYEVKEREGKQPLLIGELQVILKEGVGTLGDLTFTDNSSWIRSRKFRLGTKVAYGFCDGIRIREAKSEAFSVKDHRGELYKKHYPPALHDEVWRLDRIAKDGALHKKLAGANIATVEDFLRFLVRDPQKLRSILGSGMSNRMWDNTVEHAKTCVLGGKIYIYYTDATQTTGVVFSDIYELMGLIAAGQFFCVESLSPDQKVLVDMLVKRAYDDWNHVVEYDSKVLQSSINSRQNAPIMDYETPSEDYLMPMKQNQHSSPSDTGSSYVEAESSSTQLALETSPSSSYAATYPPRSEDCFDEEEIRIRSTEMLEHDDMQHLLQSFTVLVGSNASEPCYSYTIAPPSEPRVQEHNNRVNAKASISWVKLKAAFRWGIFTRKRAAERRAQLVELD